MLTLRDCIDFSDLKEEEILAIAECEQIVAKVKETGLKYMMAETVVIGR